MTHVWRKAGAYLKPARIQIAALKEKLVFGDNGEHFLCSNLQQTCKCKAGGDSDFGDGDISISSNESLRLGVYPPISAPHPICRQGRMVRIQLFFRYSIFAVFTAISTRRMIQEWSVKQIYSYRVAFTIYTLSVFIRPTPGICRAGALVWVDYWIKQESHNFKNCRPNGPTQGSGQDMEFLSVGFFTFIPPEGRWYSCFESAGKSVWPLFRYRTGYLWKRKSRFLFYNRIGQRMTR